MCVYVRYVSMYVCNYVCTYIHSTRRRGARTEAAALLHRLADVVSAVEGASALTIRSRLLDQLTVIIARGSGRSIRRRREALRAVCADL